MSKEALFSSAIATTGLYIGSRIVESFWIHLEKAASSQSRIAMPILAFKALFLSGMCSYIIMTEAEPHYQGSLWPEAQKKCDDRPKTLSSQSSELGPQEASFEYYEALMGRYEIFSLLECDVPF